MKNRRGIHTSLREAFSGLFIYLFLVLYICASIAAVIGICSLFFDPYDYPLIVALAEVGTLFVISFFISVIAGVVYRTRKLEMMNKLVTFPGEWNYNWQGGYSIIVFLILHIVTFFRSVSLLQLGKYLYRRHHTNNKDVGSNRANVPPIFQEVYYILWIIFLVMQLETGWFNELVFGLDIYFIIESLTWILYYSVFRRFFEERYSIYHVLEHLPLVLMLIPMQAVAYARVVSHQNPDLTWKDVLVVMLGQAENNLILFSCIGFLYSAIVISMILSMFPTENVKRGNPDTIIVGAGDVVKCRLLPAMLRRMQRIPENKRGKIRIYDLKSGEQISSWEEEQVNTMWGALHLPKEEKIHSVFDLINSKNPAGEQVSWICTPSDTHWYYLELLRGRSEFVVVEKPITSRIDELERYREFIESEYRNQTFFLSYYLLEKALPLTFLARPRRLYLKYLSGYDKDGNQILDEKRSQNMIGECYERYLGGGEVRRFSMTIIEKSETRKLPRGGQLVETFMHNCIIASLFAGLPSTWTDVHFKSLRDDSIEMIARGRNRMSIHLLLQKDSRKQQEQSAEILMENNGKLMRIQADLTKKNAVIYAEKEEFSFGVKEQFLGKYDVQCAMVYDCFENGVRTAEVDGLYNQIETLEWLMNLEKKEAR